VVEASLVLLVFLATLLAIFDLGQCLFIHQTFAARARAAARYGVVHDFDAATIRNMVLYGQPLAPSGQTSGIFGLREEMVTVKQEDIGTSEQRITVTIQGYPYRLFSPFLGRAFTGRPIVVSLPAESQ
jgi:hypothetical protein